jgi:hypothetical protein
MGSLLSPYQKDGNPSKADIVKRDGALKGIAMHHHTLVVIQIPVDTRFIGNSLPVE